MFASAAVAGQPPVLNRRRSTVGGGLARRLLNF
jgi:hypothetical protein